MGPKETESLPNGKTRLVNNCGHTFDYMIRKPSAVAWLQNRPCPSCARKNPNKGNKPEAKPEPQPTPERKAPKLQDIIDEAEAPEATPEPEAKPDRPEVSEDDIEAALARFPVIPDIGVFHDALPDLLLLLQADIPVWLQGPPGTSKSTLAAQAAEALRTGFYPVSCHEMMSRTDLFGYSDAVGVDHRTPLWDAYENGGVVLLDEVDNGNPNLLAALNSALSNGHCVFGSGTVVPKHPDFRVVATANTAGLGPEHGYIGRNGVDLATRDRFVTLSVPISELLETALARLTLGEDASKERTAMRVKANRTLRARATNAAVAPDAPSILAAVRKVRSTVESRFRGSVVSPRATIHVSAMMRQGFTLAEALTAKLPGLNASELSQAVDGAIA